MNHEEYIALVQEVNRLRNETHLFNTEEVSDEALDDLKHKISVYENEHPNKVSPDSPNYFIAGGVLEGFTKVAHARRMLSINDVFTLEELADWDRRWRDYLFTIRNEKGAQEVISVHTHNNDSNNKDFFGSQPITQAKESFAGYLDVEYIFEPKLYGLSISLVYSGGSL